MSGLSPDGVPETLPSGKRVLYALGQLGWSLGSFGVMNLLYYFYDSNPDGDGIRMFPAFLVSAGVLGVAAALSRVFDGITDPLIAGLSDRSTSSFGRRRTYMAVGALPFAATSVLVFLPLSAHPLVNTIALALFIFLFYFFMTMYVTPFFALLSELGHTPDERLRLSTMISITWALGFMIGNSAYGLQGVLEGAGLSSVRAFQAVLGTFAAISAVLMYLPVFFVDERRYGSRRMSSEGSFQAVANAFRNRNFLMFTLSDLTYFLALTFIQTGVSFYVIQLLGLPKEAATTLMTALFLLSFLFYVPVGFAARCIGKKRLLGYAFLLFVTGWGVLSLWGRLPFAPAIQAGIAIVLSALPMAIFGILPNAIVADIAESDGRSSGNHKAAVFFGARTFMSKIGASVTLLIFPFVSHLGGGDTQAPTVGGIRMTAYIAALFLLLGWWLLRHYDEAAVLRSIAGTDADGQ